MKISSSEIVIAFALLVVAYSNGQSLMHIGNSEEEDSRAPSTDTNDIQNVEQSERAEEFVPTMEWQEIKPGQSIPKGLHVRINFETGLKEAKILVPDSVSNTEGPEKTIASPSLDEEALKNIASSKDAPGLTQDFKPLPTKKQKWRSIEELKESFTKQNLTISSEMEIISGLYKRLVQGPGDNNSLLVLEDLEFYVHKYDNAVHFSDLGGVDLLKHLINASQAEIAAKAALTLGSATQSNAYVARTAREVGIMSTLLARLRTATYDPTLFNRLLFAISSLVRTNSEGVEDLVAQGGSKIFRSIVEGAEYGLKSKIKVYTLVDDLLTTEREMTPAMNDLLMGSGLVEQMCRQLPILLPQSTQAVQIDKLISFLETSLRLPVCEHDYQELQPLLPALEVSYRQQVKDADVREYYQTMVDRLKLCLSQIASRSTAKREDL